MLRRAFHARFSCLRQGQMALALCWAASGLGLCAQTEASWRIHVPEAAVGQVHPFLLPGVDRKALGERPTAWTETAPGVQIRLAALHGGGTGPRVTGQIRAATAGAHALKPDGFTAPAPPDAEPSIDAQPLELVLEGGLGSARVGAHGVLLQAQGVALPDLQVALEVPSLGARARWQVLASGPLCARLVLRADAIPTELHLTLHAGVARWDLGLVQWPATSGAGAGALVVRAFGVGLEAALGVAAWQLSPYRDGSATPRGATRQAFGDDRVLRVRAEGGPSMALTLAGPGGDGPQSLRWLAADALRLEAATPTEGGAGCIWRLVLAEDAGAMPSAPVGLALERFGRRGPEAAWRAGARDPAAHPLWPAVAQRALHFLEDPRFGLARGGENAGDWPMSEHEQGNLEYDTLLGLLAAAHGDRGAAFLQAAQGAADHLIARDRDALGSGLFFPHGAGHRTGAIEPGHHWIEGLAAWVELTGEPIAARALDEVIRAQTERFAGLDLERLTPRSLGWGLLAACVALEVRPSERTRQVVRRWQRAIGQRLGRHGHLELVPAGIEGRFEVNPFVEGGILLPALARSSRLVRDPDIQRVVGALIDALARDALTKDEEGRTRLVRRIDVQRNEAQPLAARGMAEGEEAALVLAGIARTGRPLPPAFAALRAGLASTLALPRRKYAGRHLSLILRSLPWL